MPSMSSLAHHLLPMLAALALPAGVATWLSGPTAHADEPAAGPACYFKAGDRVAFFGDSITETGGYCRLVERIFRHCHPDADVTFRNNGGSGRQAAGAQLSDALKGDPTVVTIMLGMNDAINSPWTMGMPVTPRLDQYRADLTRLVQGMQAAGKVVVVLTPTLTDETCAITPFRLEGTVALMRRMAGVCAEVAAAEKVACIPLQEDFETYQDQRPLREQRLRPDGVHPTASGQYAMAQILARHLHLAGPLTTAARALSPPSADLPVGVTCATRLLPVGSTMLDLMFTTPIPGKAKLTWSTAEDHGTTVMELHERSPWSLVLPAAAWPAADGQARDVLLAMESAGQHAFFLIDLSRNHVYHLQNGELRGSLESDTDRPEGKRVCDFRFQKDGKRLLFEASVQDSQIVPGHAASCWPWSGDAVTLYLDLRPTPRFAGVALESDVYQVWFQPQLTPHFTPGFRPWYGKHLESIALPYGAKTDTGYTVGLVLDGWRNLHEQFDINKLDYIGFDLGVFDADQPPGGPVTMRTTTLQHTQRPTHIYASGLAMLDLTGKFTADSVIVANVFP